MIGHRWIGLISPRGCVEYNARFVIGPAAESLEHGKWYTPEDLSQLTGDVHFLRESFGCIEKNIKRWRCERHDRP